MFIFKASLQQYYDELMLYNFVSNKCTSVISGLPFNAKFHLKTSSKPTWIAFQRMQ